MGPVIDVTEVDIQFAGTVIGCTGDTEVVIEYIRGSFRTQLRISPPDGMKQQGWWK